MDANNNLSFALLAHQRGFIDAGQLAQVCASWSENKTVAIERILLDRALVTAEQVGEINALMAGNQRAIGPHGVTRADDPKAPTDRHNRTADFSAKPAAAEPNPCAAGDDRDEIASGAKAQGGVAPDHERTDEDKDASLEHLRKLSLDTIELKNESRSHCTLSRVHGKGGLGQMWLAIDSQLNREVALKEVLPEKGQHSEACSRLVKEAQVTGQLEHPNIIPVYELTRSEDGPPFYTMRFMRGRTLNERIKAYHEGRRAGDDDRLELRQLLSIFVGVCNALAYAHSRGVVHRDLKPHNVMLGDFGEVIVIDWGLAKMVGHPDDVSDMRSIQVPEGAGLAATIEGKILGTPAFTSPEQADGRVSQIDARSDIYGLGGILFMILTGHPPHRGTETGHSFRDTMELLKQISGGPTPRARSVDATVPAALDAIAAKAMAKERANRYVKASELADDVQRWLGDEPVSAHRDPWRERLRRWMRRHRAWTQAAAAALLIVTLVSTVAAVFVQRARRQVEKSLAAEKEAKAEATRRFKEARDAVDKSLTGVSGVLLYYPGVQTLRTELLKKAAEDYERFADEKSDDTELRAESGRAFLRLGDVRMLLNQHGEAERAYRAAESLFGVLCGVEPENADFALELAHARVRLGTLYAAVGPHAEAEHAFDAAEKTLHDLTRQFPKSLDFRYEKAVASFNRVSLLKRTAKLNDAGELLKQVEEDFRKLTLEDADPKFAEALAAARRELGPFFGMTGRNADAVAKLRAAIEVYLELALAQPNHPPYLEGLAASRVDLANAQRRLGQDSAAIEAYQTSIDDYEDLLRARPDVPYYRQNLALSRTNLAQILHTIGRNNEAKVACMTALSEFVDLVNGHPGVDDFQEAQAATSATLGSILRDLNEDALAKTAFRGAVERFGDLVAGGRKATVYRSRLAFVHSSLGRTPHKMKHHDAAREEYLAAIELFDKLLREPPDDPNSRSGLAWCHTHLGDLLRETGQLTQAATHYANALALREALDKEPDEMYDLAWLLSNCGDESFRDADRAVYVANEARKKAPANGRYWNLLGMAQYRAGKFDDSIKSLRVAIERRGDSEHASDRFVMAMAQWQEEDKDEATHSFELADEIMATNCPGNIELGKIRREAADLLGISK